MAALTQLPLKEIPMAKCDFCSKPDPTWCYPATSFMTEFGDGISENEWLACADCHALIEKDDRAGLAERGLQNPALAEAVLVETREVVLELVTNFHGQFFEHRTGPAHSIIS